MQVYEDDSLQYIDSERIRYITPTFNNSSKLEFDIQLGSIEHRTASQDSMFGLWWTLYSAQ